MFKILVVDDDHMICEMLKLMLTHKGYLPFISNKPDQTVDNVLDSAIDLLILDQFIFGVSGMAVCKELKENQLTAHLPILMMSADNEIKSECLAAGATDFIAKPFDMKELFLKIETILMDVSIDK
ncbi:response regulator [Gelidibacter sp.]|uniref:response regulator n=1 Tax=Gelidibacter sp. TaxID=2018083 RepID=UPI002BB4824A|nr:response regulator [Gelidibacter sp.]HUH27520.1 response regulator [Gelidibacter sp.]